MSRVHAWLLLALTACGENSVRVDTGALPSTAPQLWIEVPGAVDGGTLFEAPIRLTGPVRDFASATVELRLGPGQPSLQRPKLEILGTESVLTLAGFDEADPERLLVGVAVVDADGGTLDLPDIGETVELGRLRFESQGASAPATWRVDLDRSEARDGSGRRLEGLQFFVSAASP